MQQFERITSFIRSYIKDDKGELGEIYARAIETKVPVMRPETRELIKTQLLLKKPTRVLEIGTAVGYSALFMSRYLSDGAYITTIELDEDRVSIARENIKKLGKEEVIEVLKGDASEVLKTLTTGAYDFAFVDAAKGQYINYYEEVMRLVKPGGLIISDNILQGGDIIESHYTVEKRNRTIHDRMREYLYTICNDERLETSLLSVGDGVAISVKSEKQGL